MQFNDVKVLFLHVFSHYYRKTFIISIFTPFLTGSKTSTSRFERNKEDKWEITARKDPIKD
jgi:hypothetical protein